MRAVKDLPDIDPTAQKEPIAFDFYPYLPTGVLLTGTPVVTIAVIEGVDASPASRAIGAPTLGTVSPPDGAGVSNTAVIQMIGTCVAGVEYLLLVSCGRTDGGVASMWTHMKCVAPN